MNPGLQPNLLAQIIILILWVLLMFWAMLPSKRFREIPDYLMVALPSVAAVVGIFASHKVLLCTGIVVFIAAALFTYMQEREEMPPGVEKRDIRRFAVYSGCTVIGYFMFPRFIVEAIMLWF